MNIIFMGTPDFAVPCLQKLIDSKHNVLCVFSQPDKPVGRKQILTAPPVKKLAVENEIDVYQPVTLKSEEARKHILSFNAELIVVVAYGKILPKSILDAVKFGCINVHASLLPKYRGAAPIQWSVINGDKTTGVTIQQMNEGVDTGDILSVKETAIDPDETSDQLFDRLSYLGADLLLKVIDDIDIGNTAPVSQPDGDYGYAQKITKELSPIDWHKSAKQVHDLVRGLQSWPCAQTTVYGKTLKIHKTAISQKKSDIAGKVVDNNGVITVCCGDGCCLDILELQAEGKKRMPTKTYLQGNNIPVGMILGE